MGWALTGGMTWNTGYLLVALVQAGVALLLFFSLPTWNTHSVSVDSDQAPRRPVSIKTVFSISGAKQLLLMFFCYCALEQTAGLWAASYMVGRHGLSGEEAANFASLFYLGITAGRAISGFLTMKWNDTQMIRLGMGIIGIGIIVMLLPLGIVATVAGLLLAGLGCAPIYPCVIHSTPARFGADKSQAVIGLQMAAAYLGICTMPPLFGLVAEHISAGLLPIFLGGILLVMAAMNEWLNQLFSR